MSSVLISTKLLTVLYKIIINFDSFLLSANLKVL